MNTVLEQNRIPIEQIYNFYNSYKRISLIEHYKQTDIHEKQLTAKKCQLLEKIGKRLKLSTQQ